MSTRIQPFDVASPHHTPGTVPGTLKAPVGGRPPVIDAIAFGEGEIVERRGVRLEEALELKGRFPVVWINVDGLGNADVFARIGDAFALHPLALEDALTVNQRPKIEHYGGHLFAVLRMLLPGTIDTEQCAFFIGKDFLVTIQERPGDLFDAVRKRLRTATDRLRRSGPDYLAYCLIDAIVDGYFPALERYGEMVQSLEAEITDGAERWHLARLHMLKRNLLSLRRCLWPQREVVNALVRDDHDEIAATTRIYLRDCYDHAVQLMDIVETYREMTGDLMDIYLSSVNTRLNEVIKVLTIISTIFMPLAFIASLYGMNFDRQASPFNMPELGWFYGYPFVLGMMGLVVVIMLAYLWSKGWLGERIRRRRRARRFGAAAAQPAKGR